VRESKKKNEEQFLFTSKVKLEALKNMVNMDMNFPHGAILS